MVEGGMSCVKYLLFAFNLLFFLCGLGLIIAGAVVLTSFSEYAQFLGEGPFGSAATYVIIVGVIILIVAFFGCFGAIKENYCMVMTFAALLIIIFIFELAAGIAGFVLKDQVVDVIKTSASKILDEAGTGNTADITIFNTIEKDFKCCGVNGFGDWENKTNKLGGDGCCISLDSSLNNNRTGCYEYYLNKGDTGKLRNDGCVKAVQEWAERYIYIIGAVGIAWAFIEIMGIVFACCLGRAVKKEHEVV
ncbi:CD63 antigen-like isoform X1 [Lingula anatina]|uniref:Tetraspanin n=1 Tax=Lingula anatina TaxID=7574 RepID=A0A1S3J3V5_LINAN|nr:CD63 antigen-like isoform X1 [Lingula anatina]|eukprot:XP_013405080.1 CD63 antigen-like isoform X1 [Lingula anatina]